MKPKEVVLYNGSLDELNGIGEHRYKIHSNSEFVSKEEIPSPNEPARTFGIKREILERGAHGLINRRTIYAGRGRTGLDIGRNFYLIEGTLVKRV